MRFFTRQEVQGQARILIAKMHITQNWGGPIQSVSLCRIEFEDLNYYMSSSVSS
jgi:hypothetical protein